MVDSRKRTGKKSGKISPAQKGSIGLAALLGALVLINLYVFVWRDNSLTAVREQAMNIDKAPETSAKEIEAPAPAAEGGDVEGGPAPVAAASSVQGEVVKHDTLGKILSKNGVVMPDRDQIMRAVQKVYDTRMMRPGQKYTIERGPDGSVSAFVLVVSKVKTVRVQKDAAGAWIGVADEAQTRIEVEEVGGKIDSSLYASIKGAGESTELVAFFVDVFAYDLNFYVDTHPGDEFRVLVEKEYKDQEFLRYKRIIAAEYAGKDGTFRAFYHQGAKQKAGRYFDERGRSVEKSLLKTPLKFVRISSKFNPRRMHPVLHRVRGHFGVDYAAPTGTPVWAAAPGVITHRAYSGGAGNLVVIKHDDGLVTKYMHLSKFAKNQKVGQRVEGKTVIGFVGTTGLSTGPHLHFSVLKNGQHVDPLKLAPTRGRGVAKEDLAAYKAEVATLIERLAAISVTHPSVPVADEPAPDSPDGDDSAGSVLVDGETSTALAPEPPTAHP